MFFAQVKSHCARTLKNFSSQDQNSDGAIEEGTVAALIALSLEGKTNELKEIDRVSQPNATPLQEHAFGPPPTLDQTCEKPYESWLAPIDVVAGGPGGPLVDTPDPPAPDAESPEDQASHLKNYDLNDMDGQTNMAFAKLSVPNSMKDKYTFTDDDFSLSKQPDDASMQVDVTEDGDISSP